MANIPNPATPKRIFTAASELFANNSFDSISVKTIANKAEVNSALISYYYGGKAKLYQAVLLKQADVFVATISKIAKMSLTPLQKIRQFMDAETKLQLKNGNNIHIIYREMLSPTPFGEVVVKEHLFKVQDYLSQFIADGIADGSLRQGLDPKHTAFALESILAFFFMAKNHIKDALSLGSAANMQEHIQAIYNDYIDSLLA